MKTPPDLIDILKEPTEIKNTHIEPDPDDFIRPDSTGDFDMPENNEFTEPPEQEAAEPEKIQLSDDEYLQNATMIVGTIDALQTISLPFLYQRSMFTRSERMRLKEIKRMQQDNTINEVNLSEQDMILLDKYHTYLDLKDSISFTDLESEALIKPLSQVLKKYNLSLGPEVMLFTALATVTVPRFLPLFTPLERM